MRLFEADCREIFPILAAASLDAIICDPPYPEIDRAYGRLSEDEWFELMREMVVQSRRILTPTGSAVFVLQPNWERFGKMRTWLWRFLLWASEEWNIVQDVYWWNFTALPGDFKGLMRNSVKYCVWLGSPDCYRNLQSVLWRPGKHNFSKQAAARLGTKVYPSGRYVRHDRIIDTWEKRGGVTPFNLLPIAHNHQGKEHAGLHGHGAGTPIELTDWWVSYICPAGGSVADWCMGTGTTGLSALKMGCDFIGIEKEAEYFQVARQRLEEAAQQPCLF